MLFYHKGVRGRKTPLPFVACARKAAILHVQIWSEHESDVVGVIEYRNTDVREDVIAKIQTNATALDFNADINIGAGIVPRTGSRVSCPKQDASASSTVAGLGSEVCTDVVVVDIPCTLMPKRPARTILSLPVWWGRIWGRPRGIYPAIKNSIITDNRVVPQ